MKNTKTAIKELTAMYRSVLLKCLTIAMGTLFITTGATAQTAAENISYTYIDNYSGTNESTNVQQALDVLNSKNVGQTGSVVNTVKDTSGVATYYDSVDAANRNSNISGTYGSLTSLEGTVSGEIKENRNVIEDTVALINGASLDFNSSDNNSGIIAGTGTQLTAAGTNTDGSAQNLTDAVNVASAKNEEQQAAIDKLNGTADTAGSVANTVKTQGANADYDYRETYNTGSIGKAVQNLEENYKTIVTDNAATASALNASITATNANVTALSGRVDNAFAEIGDVEDKADANTATLGNVAAVTGNNLGNGTTVADKLGALNAAVDSTKSTLQQADERLTQANANTNTRIDGIVNNTLGDIAGTTGTYLGDETDTTIADKLGALNTSIGNVVSAYEQADSELNNRIDAINTTLGANIETVTGDNLGAAGSSVADHLTAVNTAISNNTTAIGTNATNIAANKTAIGDLTTATGTHLTGNDVSTKLSSLNTAVESNDKDISDLQTAVGDVTTATGTHLTGDDVATKLSSLNTAVESNDKDISNLQTTVGDITTATGTNLTGDDVATKLSSLNTGIETNATNISNNSTAIGNLQTAVGDVTAATGTHLTGDDVATKLSSLNAGIVANDTKLGDVNTLTGNNLGAAGSSVAQHLTAVDNAIGAPVKTDYNGVAGGQSVNVNIDAINKTLGDISTVTGTNLAQANAAVIDTDPPLPPEGEGTGGSTGDTSTGTSSTTVAEHLNALNSSIGDRTAVASSNAAINDAAKQSVAAGLAATGNALGSMDFHNTRYLRGSADMTSALHALDSNMLRLERKVDDLDSEMRDGFASMAALSALQPNARAENNTQVAVGTGMYRDSIGGAVGVFHYLNDNTLLNAGVSFGGSHSFTGRAGATFGW